MAFLKSPSQASGGAVTLQHMFIEHLLCVGTEQGAAGIGLRQVDMLPALMEVTVQQGRR